MEFLIGVYAAVVGVFTLSSAAFLALTIPLQIVSCVLAFLFINQVYVGCGDQVDNARRSLSVLLSVGAIIGLCIVFGVMPSLQLVAWSIGIYVVGALLTVPYAWISFLKKAAVSYLSMLRSVKDTSRTVKSIAALNSVLGDVKFTFKDNITGDDVTMTFMEACEDARAIASAAKSPEILQSYETKGVEEYINSINFAVANQFGSLSSFEHDVKRMPTIARDCERIALVAKAALPETLKLTVSDANFGSLYESIRLSDIHGVDLSDMTKQESTGFASNGVLMQEMVLNNRVFTNENDADIALRFIILETFQRIQMIRKMNPPNARMYKIYLTSYAVSWPFHVLNFVAFKFISRVISRVLDLFANVLRRITISTYSRILNQAATKTSVNRLLD